MVIEEIDSKLEIATKELELGVKGSVDSSPGEGAGGLSVKKAPTEIAETECVPESLLHCYDVYVCYYTDAALLPCRCCFAFMMLCSLPRYAASFHDVCCRVDAASLPRCCFFAFMVLCPLPHYATSLPTLLLLDCPWTVPLYSHEAPKHLARAFMFHTSPLSSPLSALDF